MLQNKHAHQFKGFTLIEMVVAMSVFVTALLIVIGALVSLQAESRKTQAARVISDNLGAAMDSMSRDIRMGTTYHCGIGGSLDVAQDCPVTAMVGDSVVAFERQGGDSSNPADQVVYRLNTGRIERSLDSGTTYVPLTAPDIQISNLKFFVQGATPILGNRFQPSVTIIINASAGLQQKTRTYFHLETTVSERVPNLNILAP